MKTTIDVSRNVSSRIHKILLNRVTLCQDALKLPDPHEGIHEARKELKIIRAILRLIRASTPKKTYKQCNSYFRNTARLLSDARDTAALLGVVMKLRDEVTHPKLQSLLEQTSYHLMAKKSAVTRYSINRNKLLEHTQEVLNDAPEYIAAITIEDKGFNALAGGIELVYRRGKKLRKSVQKNPHPEVFHEWRKQAKYLRYQIGAIRSIWPEVLDVFENQLHVLTDELGSEHDLHVLHITILNSNLIDKADWSLLFEFIATQRKQHQLAAISLGDKLYYAKPKEFVGWLNHCWLVSAKAN